MSNEIMNNGVTLKTFVPCMLIYPYADYHTCVEVFRNLTFFDFPSLPRNIEILMLLDASMGSYEIGMNIIDEDGNEIVTEKSLEQNITQDRTIYFINSFENVIFPKEGNYFFQLIIDKKVVYKHDFMALKIQKQEYHPEEIENILKDPETIKLISSTIKCGCGCTRNFSLSLDPDKQKEEEKLPDENIIQCKQCGNEINISELKANMRFHLGTKNLADVFNRNLVESRVLASNGFLNASLIMQVSAFEAYMRDSFMLSYKYWFLHLFNNKSGLDENTIKYKQNFIKYTEKLRLKSQFFDKIFVLGPTSFESKLDEIDRYNKTLKELLFGSDDEDNQAGTKIINFQRIKNESGSFWAYKYFLGIDLKSALDSQKDKYYEHLLDCFQIRHKIIHGSAKISPNKREIDSDIIIKNEKIILFIKKLIDNEIKKIEDIRNETSSLSTDIALESEIEINESIEDNNPEHPQDAPDRA